MRTLAALMCAMAVLTTLLLARALATGRDEGPVQPAQLDRAPQVAVVPGK